MANIFQEVQTEKQKYSTFNMSYRKRLSFDMGKLVPCHIQEIVPGDRFNHKTSQILRFAPMLAPPMHDVNVYIHYFFVPNRIIWKGWEDFITGGEDGLDEHIPPYIKDAAPTVRSLGDYLDLPVTKEGPNDPTKGNTLATISALPFMAYQKIWNDYYRDQNYQEEVNLEAVLDGENAWMSQAIVDITKLQDRAWNHDYFTSALPEAQKGTPVTLPLTKGQVNVPLIYDASKGTTKVYNTLGEVLPGEEEVFRGDDHFFGRTTNEELSVNVAANHYFDFDNVQAEAASIADLRTAFKMQEYLERQARSGGRYTETIRSHFGVISSDARLQRPEYLGGGISPVLFSEVLQTSSTEGASTPQANMAGHGLNLGKNNGYSRFFEEHGYVIGIISVMPKTAYQQGIPRHWRKFDKFDYYWPVFQHIGEQAIKNSEVMGYQEAYEGTLGGPDGEWGYIPRYSEYKFNNDVVNGDFKDTLDFWHLGRIFPVLDPPVLNEEFIKCKPDNRIFAVQESPENRIYCYMFHDISARRKMSYFGSPGFR